MIHQGAIGTGAKGGGDRPPRSAVSHGVGLAGLAGLVGWVAFAHALGLDGPYGALVAVAACGGPMLAWSLIVDRVHRARTTGIDWTRRPRRLSATLDISLAKLAGLWATWGIIAILYATGRWYWQPPYLGAMRLLGVAAPVLFLLSIPYVLWLDRRLAEPRDGAWAFGRMLMGQAPAEGVAGAEHRALVAGHLRGWAVKGFFTAFMIAIVPGNYAQVIHWDVAASLTDPAALARGLIAFMFLIDVAFATVGYLMTFRWLDAHIRSANPYAAGWMAALICYPPFVLMGDGGPLDYHPGTAEWDHWLTGHPAALAIAGGLLVALTAVYAWATVAFGPRFSNLTHRGIITHGPYRWSRHPAYLAKNLFWWLATMPFLATTGSIVDAARNSIILALVSGVYYWRARTEEAHLSADPVYRAYGAWMARRAPVPRAIRRLTGGQAAPAPAQ